MPGIADRLEVLDDNTLAIVSSVDADELRRIAAHCERVRNSGKVTAKGDITHLGSYPEWVIRNWCNRVGVDYARGFLATEEYNEAFANSEEAQAFRYWKGRV